MEEQEIQDKVAQAAESDAPAAASVDLLAEKEAEVQAERDRYMRLAAEFENYKKRMVRDRDEFRKYANESFIREVLPVIDNLERALKHASESGQGAAESLVTGVEMTLKQFKGALEKAGVREAAGVGAPFDPACHEAVAHVETTEHENNVVIEEFQKGYYLADRVLRPAMVSVAKRVEPAGNA